MESIRNAASAAAGYVGYGQTDQELAGNQLGEALQERQGGSAHVPDTTSSGQKPYDSGNIDGDSTPQLIFLYTSH